MRDPGLPQHPGRSGCVAREWLWLVAGGIWPGRRPAWRQGYWEPPADGPCICCSTAMPVGRINPLIEPLGAWVGSCRRFRLNGSAMAAPPSRSVIASCSGVPCLLAAQSLSSPGYPASVLVVVFPGRRGTASLLQLARKLQRSQEQAAQLERAPALAVVEISAADASFSPARQR